MAKRKHKTSRTVVAEPIADALSRVQLTEAHAFGFEYRYAAPLLVTCPRCQEAVAIRAATVGLELSCGHLWYPPRHGRGANAETWLSYGSS
jgi:hypothetical protein